MGSSNKRKYVIATIKSWNIEKARGFISEYPDFKILLVSERRGLTYQRLKDFNPKYIFIPHWSWIISRDIYEKFECVLFHMTDLPFGRGGSPLQNLLERGIYKTKISAIRVAKGIDAGPVYLKRDLDLKGSASEIFRRFSEIVFDNMIPYIIKNEPVPFPQKGKIVEFKRRTPGQSDISCLENKRKLYDYIRMLDSEGYPPAFVETPKLKIEFFNARLGRQCVSANARIIVKAKSRDINCSVGRHT